MDNAKIYVGNIPFEATSTELMDFFSQYGEILEAMVIPNKRFPGKSKGFGFVTFANELAAKAALGANGKDFAGRNLVVSIAKPKSEEEMSARPDEDSQESTTTPNNTVIYQSEPIRDEQGTN